MYILYVIYLCILPPSAEIFRKIIIINVGGTNNAHTRHACNFIITIIIVHFTLLLLLRWEIFPVNSSNLRYIDSCRFCKRKSIGNNVRFFFVYGFRNANYRLRAAHDFLCNVFFVPAADRVFSSSVSTKTRSFYREIFTVEEEKQLKKNRIIQNNSYCVLYDFPRPKYRFRR